MAHAIEAARVALEQHLQTAGETTASAPLLSAHRSLLRAAHLLERKPRSNARPTATDPAAPDQRDTPPSDTGPDDLTRIRGIDSKAVERLNALGIIRFAQIAAWEPEDVRSIGMALDLGRSFQSNGVVDQAKMLIAPIEHADNASEDTVAGWNPRAAQPAPGALEPTVPALTPIELGHVHATLRQGQTHLQCIAKIVPLIARRVHVPLENIDDIDEAPWRPSPLMEMAEPVLETAPLEAAPVARVEPLAETRSEALTPLAVVIPAPEPELEPAPPVEKPLHIVTLDRIAALDAEITALNGPAPARDAAIEARATEQEPTPAHAPAEAKPLVPPPPVPRMPPRNIPTEEADIEIKVRPGRTSSLLQPMSELPLQPKRKAMLPEPMPDAPTEVSEAAVVIVKRRAPQRAAPDLEFYKRDNTTDDTNARQVTRKTSRVEGELAS